MDTTPFNTRTKLLTAYAPVVRLIREGLDPFPIQLEVNVSDACGQNCRWCISANVRDQPCTLDIENPNLQKFFQDFKRLGGRALAWSGGGEPTLHPGFNAALEMVNACGLPQGLMTHGVFKDSLVAPIADNCAWIRISIDTHEPRDYAYRRGTKPESFHRVLENTKALVAKGAYVGLNMNVAEWNKTHIEPLYELACELKVNYLQVRPTLTTPFPLGEPEDYLRPQSIQTTLARVKSLEERAARENRSTRLLVSYDKFSDIQKTDGGRAHPSEGYCGCKAHNMFVVLNCNGELMVCMYHLFNEQFVLGNVYRDSLEAIWASNQRQAVKAFCEQKLNHKIHQCQICCKGHEINKVLLGSIDGAQEEDSGPLRDNGVFI